MTTGLGWATDGMSVAQRHVGVSSFVTLVVEGVTEASRVSCTPGYV
jgi:hypothetical protein